MSLKEWLAYLENIHPKPIDLGLERVRQVVERVCVTPACPIVTVGGTNGKGTTVAALQALASQEGWRIGVYTSPHLFVFNERIVFDLPGRGAVMVTDEALVAAFEKIEEARQDVSLTYFEFTTLAALYLFKQMPLDLVILEVGMGGRLDCTNIVDADIAIITRIALDHTDYLGNTREAIATEKAGIMRRGKPCIYGGDDLYDCMQDLAMTYSAKLYAYDQASSLDVTIQHASLVSQIPHANLWCAAKAFEMLGGTLHESMWSELLMKKPAGRFTSVRFGDKTVVFDVAHNPDAMQLLATQIAALEHKDIRMIVGMLRDKDHMGSLSALKNDPRITFYVSAPQGTNRAAKPAQLMEALSGVRAYAFDTLGNAWHASLKNATTDTIWVVAGSFFTVAQMWQHVREWQRSIACSA